MSISNSIKLELKTRTLQVLSSNYVHSSELKLKKIVREVKLRGFAKITNDRGKVRLKRK